MQVNAQLFWWWIIECHRYLQSNCAFSFWLCYINNKMTQFFENLVYKPWFNSHKTTWEVCLWEEKYLRWFAARKKDSWPFRSITSRKTRSILPWKQVWIQTTIKIRGINIFGKSRYPEVSSYMETMVWSNYGSTLKWRWRRWVNVEIWSHAWKLSISFKLGLIYLLLVCSS